ncbi:tumor protein D53 homolog isoform X1 [Oncorhynchus tshawytscha]|uniref:tumor protein D53 homolog isoform X1 n=1 Tax=Oncorhynchus tshawytscha TaxID=74940 RepID=UPI000D0A1C4F|nr:tumor protein D53 homolog isoform X1 [Oncorhynchus tshawytscha]
MNRQGCSGENVSPRNISIGISRNGLTNGLSEEDEDDLKMELAKTEDEMQTLRQVLLAKEKYAVDIKRQLGMGPFSEIKHNMSKGWHEVQTSNMYKMTHDTISHAGQISTAAMSTMGVAITRRLGEMRALPLPSPPRPSLSHSISVPAMSMRHSNTFKSFEDMVGSMKNKVSGSRGNDGNVSGFGRSPSQNSGSF